MAAHYSARQILVVVGGVSVVGLAAGDDAVAIERLAPDWTLRRGDGGIHALVRGLDRSARVRLRLLASSVANDLLSALRAGQLAGAGGVPLAVKDSGGVFTGALRLATGEHVGRTVAAAETCWIEGPPPVAWGETPSDRTWSLITDDLTLYVGGMGDPSEAAGQLGASVSGLV